MPRNTDAMPEDYWESLPDGGSEDLPDTILSEICSDAEEYGFDVIAVDVADKSDSEIYCLVIRRKVSDSGDLILSERYYRYDLDERAGSFTSNGIERRVGGSMIAALRVLYASLGNGDAAPDDPMLLDSTDSGLKHEAPDLTDPTLLDPDTDTDSDEQDLDTDTDSDEQDDDRLLDGDTEFNDLLTDKWLADRGLLDEPDRKGWVICRRCGSEVREDDAVQFGSGDLGEYWIHDDPDKCDGQEGSA